MSRSLREGPAPEGPFDVAVVGAGAVGCAVARELSRRGASCALVEAGPDVGAGTSKANTAILHTGFDAKPGTIESGLVARGYELLSEYASEVGIPTANLGALMIAWNAEQRDALAGDRGDGARERVRGGPLGRSRGALCPRAQHRPGSARVLSRSRARGSSAPSPRRSPSRPRRSAAGCELILNAAVTGVRSSGGGHEVETARGAIRARHLVNAAGLRSDEVDAMLGHSGST